MKRDFSKIDRVIREFEEKRTMPGCAVSIMQGDEVVYEGFAGYSDIEAKKPVTRDSMFRQASTTKLFTYAIMGMLFEEGRFLFSDPIGYYLPEWKNTKKWVVTEKGEIDLVPVEHPITIRNTVSMMCGLPYCMTPAANPDNPTVAAMSERMAELLKHGTPTLREEVRAMADVPVMFEPGSHWLYGFGSEITGALVETFTDKPLREVLRERIIEPLELEHTDTYITDANRDHLVKAYTKDAEGGFHEAPTMFDATSVPGAAPVGARPNLLMSANDFAAFTQMLANGGTYKGRKLMAQGTVDMLHENQLSGAQMKDFVNDYHLGYGYGLGFRTLMEKKYGHNGNLGAFGWTGGFGTYAEADPVAKLAIVYMHNMMPNEELYHHLRVRNAAYGCML